MNALLQGCCACKVADANVIDILSLKKKVTPAADPALEQERERLTTLMSTFAVQALAGCPCTYVHEATGKRVAAMYRTDKSFENLTITSVKGSSVQVVCPISEILDVYNTTDDVESCFPPKVLSSLGRQDALLLLRIIYKGAGGEKKSFCILEDNPDSRDVFFECVRILHFYALAQQEGSAAGGQA